VDSGFAASEQDLAFYNTRVQSPPVVVLYYLAILMASMDL